MSTFFADHAGEDPLASHPSLALLDRFRAFAESMGGKIEIKEFSERSGVRGASRWALCPFNNYLATNYRDRKIRILPETELTASTVSALVHEMGHAFASKRAPMNSDEWSFFGWEFLTARKLGVLPQWIIGTADYVLPQEVAADLIGATSFRSRGWDIQAARSARVLAPVLWRAVTLGRKNGSIVGREPVCVRQRAKAKRSPV